MKQLLIIFFILICFKTALSESLNLNNNSQNCFFIENKGQWPSDILYYSKIHGLDVWITKNSIVYDFYKYNLSNNYFINQYIIKNEDVRENSKSLLSRYGQVVDMKFSNCLNYNIIPENPSVPYFNYFIGNNRSKWTGDVKLYFGLKIENLYSGIDLKYYFDEDNLRYDLIVHPYSDPTQIIFDIQGTEDVFINDNGELVINTIFGKIIHKNIFAYQVINGKKVQIECKFKSINNKTTFELGDYNAASELIIDPLVYSTFIGGGDFDSAEDITVDKDGNVYIVGYSSSVDFPSTPGVYQEKLRKSMLGYPDIYVSKFDSTGKNLIYSTFIGGFLDDFGIGIAINDSQCVFITGYTGQSKTFPVTKNAYDTLSNGGYDAFVIKLNPTGSQLEYSTLIGGASDDYGQAIKIDKFDCAFITGYTKGDSINFPVTDFAIQKIHHGENDVFITKLSDSGNVLLYSTLLGGKADEFSQDIVLDSLGNAYIVGITKSDDFPTTANAFDNSYNDTTQNINRSDAFISKINSDGTALVFSTYFGGMAKDGAYGIFLDSAYDIYIAGYSESEDFPVTPNAYDTMYRSPAVNLGAGDIIVSKFNPDGNILKYSTFIGGSSADRGYAIFVDDLLNAYITGTTSSADFDITKNAYDKIYNDTSLNSDVFVVKLNPSGSRLSYSSYLGGKVSDVGKSLVVLNNELMLVTGTTSSTDFPTSDSAYQTKFNSGMSDGFFTKINTNYLSIEVGSDKIICRGSGTYIGEEAIGGSGSMTYTWSPDYGLSATNVPIPYASPDSTTTYFVEVNDQKGRISRDTIVVTVNPVHQSGIWGPQLVYRESKHYYVTGPTVDIRFTWLVEGGYIISGQKTHRIKVNWTDSLEGKVILISENEYGCIDTTDPYIVMIGETFKPMIYPSGPTTFCEGDSLILDAGEDYMAYDWCDNISTRFDTIRASGLYWVTVTDSSGFAGISDTIKVTVLPRPPVPTVLYRNGILECMTIYLLYQWYKDGDKIFGARRKTFTPTGPGSYKVEVFGNNGCTNFSDTILIPSSVNDKASKVPIKIYPNPNDGTFIVEANFENSGYIQIKIINILGVCVYKFNDNNEEGLYRKELNLENILKGMYYLVINSDNNNYVNKIIIE